MRHIGKVSGKEGSGLRKLPIEVDHGAHLIFLLV